MKATAEGLSPVSLLVSVVIQVVLTNQVWAGFSLLHVNTPCKGAEPIIEYKNVWKRIALLYQL